MTCPIFDYRFPEEFPIKLKQVLEILSKNNIKLKARDGNLHVRAKGGLTSEARDLLSKHKAEILEWLDRKKKTEDQHLTPLKRTPRDKDLPLSYSQQRMWVLENIRDVGSTYCLPEAIHLQGRLCVDNLERAFQEIIRRHEILRTSFQEKDGYPQQIISHDHRLAATVLDLSDLSQTNKDHEVLRLTHAEANTRFNLAKGPVVRAKLLRTSRQSHVLLVSFHHIVSDGWSLGILVHELATLYQAFVSNLRSPLAELPFQYADYSAWLRNQYLTLKEQLKFWEHYLADLPPLLELPTVHHRPEDMSYRGSSAAFSLEKPLMDRLIDLGREQGATLFMTLLASFKILLARYSGRSDIPVGSVVANRPRTDLEQMIGYFANTLVFRSDVSGNPSFKEFLKKTVANVTQVYQYQGVQFEMIVDMQASERSLAHTPIFQVMLVLHNQPKQDLRLPGLLLSPIERETDHAKFDLTLSLTETELGLVGALEFATDLFDLPWAQRLLDHFRQLIESILVDPDQPIMALDMLSTQEHLLHLQTWNTANILMPAWAPNWETQCLHQIFKNQAQQTPESPALSFEGQIWTYQKLAHHASLLTNQLIYKGVRPGDFVGISLPRSPEMIVAILAVLGTGAAYVPIDPKNPPERTAYILQDATVNQIITQTDVLDHIAKNQTEAVLLDETWVAVAKKIPTQKSPRVFPQNVAYCIYTSGTTGKPKGIGTTHANVVRLFTRTHSWFNDPPPSVPDVWSQFFSFAFDFSVWEIWGALLHGGKLAIVPHWVTRSAREFHQFLVKEKVTVLSQTPSVFKQLIAEDTTAADPTELSLRTIVFGGEALEFPPLRGWVNKHPLNQVNLVNMYGITETTVHVTYHALNQKSLEEGQSNIGKPLPDLATYLLDEYLNLVPQGVLGEIHVSGAGLSPGYLNRPSLTAQRFIPDPFSKKEGQRLYRSGDLAKHLPDGNMVYAGRKDRQVKIRGFRIELGEIETGLLSHPEVSQAAVCVREDQPGHPQMIGYVVCDPQNSTPLDVTQLRKFLSEILPAYMLPAKLITLEQLPLTQHGKVDFKALPQPDQGLDRIQSYSAATTPIQQVLVGLWQELLHLEKVGIDENFFELGGDSILCIQLVARARKQGLVFTSKQVFEAQTIAKLSPLAKTNQQQTTPQTPVTGTVLATPIQNWFFAQDFNDPHHYNQTLLLETKPDFVPPIFSNTLTALCVHHDGLRTRFERQQESWQQIIGEPVEQALFQSLDLAALTPQLQLKILDQVASQTQASLNLEKGPLIRAVFFDFGSRGGRLLLVAHHLIIDGVSWRILMEDLESGYQQLVRNQTIQFPPKTTAFQTWAQHLYRYAQSLALKKEMTYWNQLAELTYPEVPLDYPGENRESSLAELHVELDATTTKALLQDVPSVYNTHINDLLLGAFALAYREWTGSSKVLLELEGHGRENIFDHLDVTRTLGWFTSLFPICLEVPEDAKVQPGIFIKTIKENLRRTPNNGIGFGLLKYLRNAADESASPLKHVKPQISFNYLGRIEEPSNKTTTFTIANEGAGSIRAPKQQRAFILDITCVVHQGQLRMSCGFSKQCHRHSTIQGLLNGFKTALQTLIEHCQQPEAGGFTPSDFSDVSLSQAQLDQLILKLSHAQLPAAQQKHNIEAIFPLSPLQQGLLYHSQLAPDSGIYVVQMTCQMVGFLDKQAFRKAWEFLLQQHGILRALFQNLDTDQPFQVLRKTCQLPWHTYDWRHHSQEKQTELFEALTLQDRKQGFDLEKAPLLRVLLAQLADDRYRLVFSHHHALLDGWSFSGIFSDLFAAYQAFKSGQTPIARQVRPFQDYVRWLQAQNRQAAKTFWSEYLHGFQHPNSIVVARPATETPQPFEKMFYLNTSLTNNLEVLSKKEQLTLNIITQGMWAILLSRYSGEKDIVFGTIVSGRPPELEGVEDMIGPFINTIPFRAVLDDGQTVLQLFKRWHCVQIDREPFTYTPLVDVIGWSDLPGGVPLFESLLAFENYPIDSAYGQAEDLMLEFPKTVEQTNYPLTLMIEPGENLALRVIFDRTRFDLATVERMVGHYEKLLESFVANPHSQVEELALTSPAERRLAWKDWNNTQTPTPQQTGLAQWVAEQVERTPKATAVIFQNNHYSYQQVHELGLRVGARLLENGVQPNQLVAVILNKSWLQIPAVLGVHYAGAAYLPIDPDWPLERRHYLLDFGQVSSVVTSADLSNTTTWPQGIDVFAIDSPQDMRTDHKLPAEAMVQSTSPDDLAYVIFTSGSTGKPKGVVLNHRGPLNTCYHLNRAFEVGTRDRVLALSSLSFDLSVYDVFGVLAAGGAIVIPTQEEVKNPAAWLELMQTHQVTLWNTVPALMQILIDYIEAQGVSGNEWLRAVFMSGDWIPVPLPNRIKALFKNAVIWSMGGATEASIWSIHHPIEKVEPNWNSIPYGKAMPNQAFYVLDANLTPCPVGVPGHLHIGGVGLAQGYWRDPEKTNASFFNHPINGIRLYRTGDLGRYFADGTIEFLGRDDFQVKVNGYRIELGEIEHALEQNETVHNAVVVAPERAPKNRILVAYIVAKPGLEPETDALRSSLKTTLPDYMIPSKIMILEQFPLTANGKVDRKSLPAPDLDLHQTGHRQAARNVVQELLVTIWADVLDVEKVGIQDNFFDLGGHSLLATQIIARVRHSFSVNLSLAALFETPTLEALAAKIEILRAGETEISALKNPILPVPRDKPLPLSFGQQRLWFLDQLEGPSGTYNISATWRFQGHLSFVDLANTMTAIITRHEVLRANFVQVDAEPMVAIRPPQAMPITIVDISELWQENSNPNTEPLLQKQIATLADAPFDLKKDLLIRCYILRLAPQDHLLLVTKHHIVSDGWSMGVLFQDFATLYNAQCRQQSDPLTILPFQYADYAQWQRIELSGAEQQRQLDFWRNYLRGAPPLLEMPTDFPRPAMFSFRGETIPFNLPEPLYRDLLVFSRKHGVTLYMTMLSGFQILLSQYSGQPDIVVGTIVANRQHQELEALIGLFLNALVIRTDLSAPASIRDLLTQVRSRVMEAFSHQDIPFEQLVEAIQPNRSLSHTPIFQAMFNFQNMPMGDIDLPCLDMAPVTRQNLTAKFDLVMNLTETDTGISIDMEYCTDLFKAETIERLLHHYAQLLQAMILMPDTQPRALPLLSEDEFHCIWSQWNETQTDLKSSQWLHRPVEAQMKRNPDAVSLVAGQHFLTYQALNKLAVGLAADLIAAGAKPNTLIAIVAEKGSIQVAAALAIQMAGAAYLPIDPQWPDDRRNYLLEFGEVALVVTDKLLTKSWPADIRLFYMQDYQHFVTQQSPLPQLADQPLQQPQDLAYVIFTSGSTGKPKGVMIEHQAALNTIEDINQRFAINAGDKVLGLSNLSFDLSVYDIYGPLAVGGTLVLPEQASVKEPFAWSKLVYDHRISLWNTVPTLMNMLVETLEAEPLEGKGPLRVVMMSGDWIPLTLPPRIQSQFPTCEVYSLGGATEGSIWSIIFPIQDVAPEWQSIPYGRPMANQKFYVLNQALEPCPLRVTGHLYIGGVGLARGYWRDREKTEASFMIHPKTGERIYRTGDLGRYMEPGLIEFLGRADFQVKVNGYRIELGEIEAVLCQDPTVSEAVVIAKEDATGGKQLAAFLMPEEKQQIDLEHLQTYPQAALPEYMQPTSYLVLDTLPLTGNGKVDRKALARLDTPQPKQREQTPPRTQAEKQLHALWCEILNIRELGIHDDFFDLGGHSLLATRMMTRIRDTFSLQLPLRTIFENASIALLAACLGELQRHTPATRVPIPKATRDQPLPLSFSQQRLWFFHQLEPGDTSYNIPFALGLRGQLDVPVLQQAFQTIVARHDILRTHFIETDNHPVQIIQEAIDFELPYLDLSHLADSEHVVSELAQQEAWSPFNLATGPLFRLGLIKVAKEQYVLLLTMHHIATDGWSMGIIVREFVALYHAFLHQASSPLSPLPIQYVDFAIWQRNLQKSDAYKRQLDFWHKKLAHCSGHLALPYDHSPQGKSQSFGATVSINLDPDVVQDLVAFGKQEAVSLFMTTFAAFNLLLQRYSGQTDITVGIPIANRQQPELEPMIGFFVNTLVLRTTFDEPLTFRDLVLQTSSDVLSAHSNQDVPYDQLVAELRPGGDALFRTMCIYEDEQDPLHSLPGLALESLSLLNNLPLRSDLDLYLGRDEGELKGHFIYNRQLFEAATIERMARRFEMLLKMAAETPDKALVDFELDDSVALPAMNLGMASDPACSAEDVDPFESDDPFAWE